MSGEVPSYTRLLQETPDSLQQKMAASPEEAARWVEAAARSGSKAAIINWGQMLLDGHGTARDPERALRWFRIAAETGSADGINMVGRCHELGWGTPQDFVEAARCYNLAAAMGHVWAKFNLGLLLAGGQGVDRDLKRGLSLFVAAARAGNAKAMNMLGRYCEEGWHGRPKPAAAMRWYRRAALRGCFRGQFHLARFHAAGGDITQARSWLMRSIEAAPADFCREIAPLLQRHPSEDIRSMAAVALTAVARQSRSYFLDSKPPGGRSGSRWLLRFRRKCSS